VDDALRIELSGSVYAIWHTTSGFYATQGLCTHEQANLADGLVEGEYVSCPKHNSRFHIPTGKAMRIPARVDLKTYPVKNEGGKLYVGLPG
jgi:3-phenylpropionate/trans-cinnamate dioxygenase ferredoxin subunit